MKFTRWFFALIVLMVLSISVNVFAEFTVHVVDTLGEKTTFRDDGIFQLNETPYLYFNVADLQPLTFGGSYWFDPNSNIEFTAPALVTGSDVWYTLDWNNVSKTPGSWTVEGWYKFPRVPNYVSDTVTFNYAPEPVSTTLFLLGGATLAVRRLRKGRKA